MGDRRYSAILALAILVCKSISFLRWAINPLSPLPHQRLKLGLRCFCHDHFAEVEATAAIAEVVTGMSLTTEMLRAKYSNK
jgi:hypothetical protein